MAKKTDDELIDEIREEVKHALAEMKFGGLPTHKALVKIMVAIGKRWPKGN